ncbi:MAG: alpha/beta hydrolase, partial [Candidatus Manganitrophaceae bacterium]
WTASNDDSGKKLAAYINDVIAIYKNAGRLCEKVILITHSMGGLVARSACKSHGAESKVLEILHGVQPATGAPSAYWRMKAGFERPSGSPAGRVWDWLKVYQMVRHHLKGYPAAWTLGTDGEEVTALLGNMPGGLELLPNKRYVDNQGKKEWLTFPDEEGKEVRLPQGNTYKEIYLAQEVFYRLVNPEWLDPGKREKTVMPSKKSSWQKYKTYLSEAEQFHDRLGDYVHPLTYQFCSTGLKTVDRVIFTREEAGLFTEIQEGLKQIGVGPLMGMRALQMLVLGQNRLANRGGYRDHIDLADRPVGEENGKPLFVVTMQPPTEVGGDGTVPDASATFLKAQETIDINNQDEGSFQRGHQEIFATRTAQGIVFAGVENLCLERITEVVG